METKNNKKGNEVVAEVAEAHRFNNVPQIESKVSKSKDGRFVIHKTIITDIRPVNYYKAVVEQEEGYIEA